MALVRGFTVQSFEKLALTEGEKFVLAGFNNNNLAETGVYSLVSNLGSLVARMIFQPLEESSYAEFSTLLGSNAHGVPSALPARRQATVILTTLLKCVLMLGLIFVCFGPAYSYLLLDILYGQQWVATSAPHALSWYVCAMVMCSHSLPILVCLFFVALARAAAVSSALMLSCLVPYVACRCTIIIGNTDMHAFPVCAFPRRSWQFFFFTSSPSCKYFSLHRYCVYVLLMALNGITEAFVFAAIPATALSVYNALLLLFSVVYIGASVLLLPFGSVGLILANCVNLSARILYSAVFIRRFLQQASLESHTDIIAIPTHATAVTPHVPSASSVFQWSAFCTAVLPSFPLAVCLLASALTTHASFLFFQIGSASISTVAPEVVVVPGVTGWVRPPLHSAWGEECVLRVANIFKGGAVFVVVYGYLIHTYCVFCHWPFDLDLFGRSWYGKPCCGPMHATWALGC
jgi:hypothetical protein